MDWKDLRRGPQATHLGDPPALCSLAALAMGLLALAGGILGLPRLQALYMDVRPMRAATAAACVAVAAALFLVRGAPGLRRRAAGALLAAAAALGGAWSLAHHILSWGASAFGTPAVGRWAAGASGLAVMAPASAISVALLGSALALHNIRRASGVAHILAMLGALPPVMTLIGDLLGIRLGLEFPQQDLMPLSSALACLVLALGALSSSADGGIMAVAAAPTLGGRMLRRLVPLAVATPLCLDWLRTLGERAGIIPGGSGVALFAFSNLVVFGSIFWWVAYSLHRVDRERARAEHWMEIESRVSRVLNESASLEEASLPLLKTLCRHLQWPAGTLWTAHESEGSLHVTGAWPPPPEAAGPGPHATPPGPARELAGRVRDCGEPCWDPEWDDDGPRSTAGLLRLEAARHNGLAFPIRAGGKVTGVMEFRNDGHADPDFESLGLLLAVSGQIGQLVERQVASEALRESTRAMAAMISSSPVAIVALDRDLLVTEWNPVAETLFGWTKEEVLGRPYPAVPPEGRAQFDTVTRAAFRGEHVDSFETSRSRKSGGIVHVIVSIAPLRGPGGQVTAIVGAMVDVSGQRQLELQLAQAQKLESIGQLAAGIAHEINTPTQYVGDNTRFLKKAFTDLVGLLSGYSILLDAARNGTTTPDLIETVDAAIQEADLEYLTHEIPAALSQTLEGVERVTRIVRAMKDFSHPGSNEKVATDLNHAIESTLTVARNEWKYVADMVTDLDPGLPQVPCLVGEFNQVILNLVVNAAHAIREALGITPQEKGVITVSTRLVDGWAEIRVRDTGAGIPEAIRGRIFDPFFTTKGVGRGTGQGLAISHQVIVKRLGGSIEFESEVGRGTTFVIRLPVDSAEPLPQQAA